jgi:prevent-host-death family protein
MTTAGVAALKASLSEYLKRVKAGEEVVVTERGRPIARLVPVPRVSGPTEAEMEEMVAAGLIRPPERELDAAFEAEFWSMPMPDDPDGLVLQALLDERAEGR